MPLDGRRVADIDLVGTRIFWALGSGSEFFRSCRIRQHQNRKIYLLSTFMYNLVENKMPKIVELNFLQEHRYATLRRRARI